MGTLQNVFRRIVYFVNKKDIDRIKELELEIKLLKGKNNRLNKKNGELETKIYRDKEIIIQYSRSIDTAEEVLRYRKDREELISKLHNTTMKLCERLKQYESVEQFAPIINEGMKWENPTW